MSTPLREGPNPLRPYYIPPSVGLRPAEPDSVLNSTRSTGGGYGGGGGNLGGKGAPTTTTSSQTPLSSARGLFSELDYADYYLPDGSQSVTEVAKKVVDQALWKYASVLLAQPFEVAKTILQCQSAAPARTTKRKAGGRAEGGGGDRGRPHDVDDPPSDDVEDDDDDSDRDVDELAYFTAAAPAATAAGARARYQTSPVRRARARSHRDRDRDRHSRSPRRPRSPATRRSPASGHALDRPRSHSVLETIAALWRTEGGWGVWKGSHASFLHSVLLKTLESWTRSLLCALLNVPEPGASGLGLLRLGPGNVGVSVLDSAQPLASLGIAVVAAACAGVVLAPLDIVRTRFVGLFPPAVVVMANERPDSTHARSLILTPTSHPARSLLPALAQLRTWRCPRALLPITLLHSTLPTLWYVSTPLVLRARLGLDPVGSPTAYSLLTFCSSALELLVRLPLETVLRRGQAAVAGVAGGAESTSAVVGPVGPFLGVVGTMWSVVNEDGSPHLHLHQQHQQHRAQGVQGLWRGWRVGMWGLVGMWGAAALGAAGTGAVGGEF
ncbi:MAG: mitochondrial fusion and transport protein ugo1 [Phylliscum demangeonii]|nr:MAG: mitochondrial fusion and transport protein ugo1 [Phylliscum demangeonii]